MKNSGIQLIAEFYGCSPNILDNEQALKEILVGGIQKANFHHTFVGSQKFEPIGVTVISIINESHIAIHTYPEAHHASIDIYHCSKDPEPLYVLLDYLKEALKPKSYKFMEINRGEKLELSEKNAVTSHARYGFEVRYFYDQKLVDHKSKYQKIVVIDNITFGRMLFLDGILQIAEKDAHLYHRTLVAPLSKKSQLEHVLILGGGDGGALNEVLKLNPQKVTLVEIDEEVIAISKKYLRSVCGKAFEDPRVKVVIDDANHYLKDHEGFDAIIYDLTPDIELLSHKDKRQFLQEIYPKIRHALKEEGIASLQCCSEWDKHTYETVRELLSCYFKNVTFKPVYIPSFCEPWVFATVIRQAAPV